jgi:hypothetical protein
MNLCLLKMAVSLFIVFLSLQGGQLTPIDALFMSTSTALLTPC